MSAPLSLGQVAGLVEQVAAATPRELDPIVTGYRDSATSAAELWTRAGDIDRLTAEGFVSAGREVFDAAAATDTTRRLLGDAGEQYHRVGDALRVVVEELTSTQDGVLREWGLLETEVMAVDAAQTALARQSLGMTQVEVDDRARALRERFDAAVEGHGGRIARLIDAYTDVLINRTRVLVEVAEEIGSAAPAAADPFAPPPPPPAGGDPAEVNAWWNGLSEPQRGELIRSDPGLVGNLDGIPAESRDAANRGVLGSEVARYEAQHRDLQARVEALGQRPPWLPGIVLPIAEAVAQAELDDLTGRLDGLHAIQARLDSTAGGPPAYLLGLRADTESGGQAIVAIGNPDSAANVATYVPGTFAAIGNSEGDITGHLADAERLVRSANRADSAEATSVITWVGYDAPQSFFPQAALDSYADDAQPALRSFQEGLRATHDGPPSFNTTVGHSYGSTVIGHTTRDGELDADRLAIIGSPGTGVDHVDELRRPPGTVYSTTSDNDDISIANTRIPYPFTDGIDVAHGRDPSSPEYGAQVFEADPDGDHGAYLRDGNSSLETLGEIIVGNEIP